MNKLFKLVFFVSLGLYFITELPMVSASPQQGAKSEIKEYPWFKDSFLDLPEDLAEAAENNRGLILYFHQEGCPYCKKLLNDNFRRPALVNKLTARYDFIELNMWGDRSVIDIDGSQLTEKTLAVKLKVMFTPTLIFIDSSGKIEFRLNGYYSPYKFNTLLDYLASERSMTFSQYFRQIDKKLPKEAQTNVMAMQETNDYASLYQQSNKPMLLILDEKNCKDCIELYANLNSSEAFKQLTDKFTITRLPINSKQIITNINGKKLKASEWADELKVQYTPSLLFFESGQEVGNGVNETFRLASYVKKFHLESVLLYIANKKYDEYPEFQRYIHDRTAKMREMGIKFDLWK